jgi:hypothetical protein
MPSLYKGPMLKKKIKKKMSLSFKVPTTIFFKNNQTMRLLFLGINIKFCFHKIIKNKIDNKLKIIRIINGNHKN